MSQPRSPRSSASRKSSRPAPASAPQGRAPRRAESPYRAAMRAPAPEQEREERSSAAFSAPKSKDRSKDRSSDRPAFRPAGRKAAPAGEKSGFRSQEKPAPRETLVRTSATPGARIGRRAGERLRAGHLWVYSSDVEILELPEGDAPALLPVADNRGVLLGTALYSPASQIALRLISREAIDEKQWLELLAERLRTAIARRKPLLAAKEGATTDSLRLVFSEADDLPGLVIDQYGDLIILQILTRGLDTPGVREMVTAVLRRELSPATILERPDPRIRELEGLSAPDLAPLWAKSKKTPKTDATFHINGISLHFDANSGQKTGAFLDQRCNYAAARDWAERLGATGRALDVCTYQGGFALHLGQVCDQVTGVDASHASLEVAERNVTANKKLLKAEFDWIQADAFELLRDWSQAGERFDTIVLDPPAFAKSKRAVEGALRGYKELNLRALHMLRPGGLLVTCSCSHHVGWTDLEAAVASAAADAGRRVRLLERRGPAPDHPVVLNLAETEYLKCLILEVE